LTRVEKAYPEMAVEHVENVFVAEWLPDKVIAARRQDDGPLFFKYTCGQGDHHRRLALRGGLNPFGGLIPIHHRHTHVHPHQMRTPCLPYPHAFLSMYRSPYCKADGRKELDEQPPVFHAVFYDQNAIGGLTRL